MASNIISKNKDITINFLLGVIFFLLIVMYSFYIHIFETFGETIQIRTIISEREGLKQTETNVSYSRPNIVYDVVTVWDYHFGEKSTPLVLEASHDKLLSLVIKKIIEPVIHDENHIIGHYGVLSDSLLLLGGRDEKSFREIWSFFTYLIPKELRQDLISFIIINSPDSNEAAYVGQDNRYSGKWDLVINKPIFSDGNDGITSKQLHILLHEFSHFYTLNSSQILPLVGGLSADEISSWFGVHCTNDFVQEGCIRDGSYIEKFIKKFWTLEQRFQAEAGVNLYNKEDYVSEYAATSPGEDIAESLTYFFLYDTSDLMGTKKDKVDFFRDYRVLQDLKKHIKKEINILAD